jgi:hypothetical protein
MPEIPAKPKYFREPKSYLRININTMAVINP